MENDLKSKTIDELAELATGLGQKSYLAKYIFSFIHTRFADSIDEITPLPKEFRSTLTSAGCYISKLKTIEKLTDPDGTVKYLFALSDDSMIETVLLSENQRKTICVSTQVGCRMGCKFCATGYLKFSRGLTTGEIIDQVLRISKDSGCKISNIVYMGMGEPLDNYDAVIKAVKMLNDPAGAGIGIRKQTISTIGIIDGIKKLADEKIYPRLAVSLHAANDHLRKKLVPAENKYPLAELIKAISHYQDKTQRRVTIEYCMLKGLNDSLTDAKNLANLLKGLKTNVNLIEYNPHPGADFKGSASGAIKAFKDSLMASGIETIIRFRRGRTIKAACGQLGADRIKAGKD